jgi:hypothetical protein
MVRDCGIRFPDRISSTLFIDAVETISPLTHGTNIYRNNKSEEQVRGRKF